MSNGMVEPSLSIDKQNLINAPKAPPTKYIDIASIFTSKYKRVDYYYLKM